MQLIILTVCCVFVSVVLTFIQPMFVNRLFFALADTHTTVIDAEREKYIDPQGYEAIRQLHAQMDDDKSGSIDAAESEEFVRDELSINEKDRQKRRQSIFHANNDAYITVDDLWFMWLSSDVRKWSTETTADWLSVAIELPQYVENFQRNAVDGYALPRLAVQSSTFVSTILGIQNQVHRRKIQVRAMDVVLFGYRQSYSSPLKDFLLMFFMASAIALCIAFRFQRLNAQKELNQLSGQMDQLKSMEKDFHQIQEQVKKQESSDIEEKSEEIEMLRSQLIEAERRFERGGLGVAPLALQPLLRKICESEMGYISKNRMENMKEMKEAMEMVEKLRRKQSNMFSSIKLAVGTESETEKLDHTIVQIKSKMDSVARTMEASQSHWAQVESLCGFPVLHGVGLQSSVVSSLDGVSVTGATPTAAALLATNATAVAGLSSPSSQVVGAHHHRPSSPAAFYHRQHYRQPPMSPAVSCQHTVANGLAHQLPLALTTALAALPFGYEGLLRAPLISPEEECRRIVSARSEAVLRSRGSAHHLYGQQTHQGLSSAANFAKYSHSNSHDSAGVTVRRSTTPPLGKPHFDLGISDVTSEHSAVTPVAGGVASLKRVDSRGSANTDSSSAANVSLSTATTSTSSKQRKSFNPFKRK